MRSPTPERIGDLPEVLIVDHHPSDARCKVITDGVVPTIVAQMGTGGNQGSLVIYRPDGLYITSRGDFHTRATKDMVGTLAASDAHDMSIIAAPFGEHGYVLRRLTPLECCRLQGFPDYWCDDLVNEDPSEEELKFWQDVWDAWMDLQGKKRKTVKQIRKWLASEPTVPAQYKMWGNGVAEPCVNFILGRIAEVETTEEVRTYTVE